MIPISFLQESGFFPQVCKAGVRLFYLPAFLGLVWGSSGWANPSGAQVVNGTVSMQTSGNTLQITASDRSIINWQNFSIGAGEITQFIQPSASAAVLNRVISGEASHLLGTLQASGIVYLLNPNGIFIGKGAVVDVGSFMATTANLSNEAFQRGGDLAFFGATDAAIRNEGTITARGGDVMLMARTVENTGILRAPQGSVGLAAGTEFLLKKEEAGAVKVAVNASSVPRERKGIGVDNRGTIEALRTTLQADGNIYSLAINQAGVVRATGVSKLADGTVALSAPGGRILNSGQLVAANLDGSGGKISVAAAEVATEAASVITAAGAVDGGEVKVAAEGDNLLSGQLSVDGATGKAGRIELTGDRVGLFDAKVTADGATGGGEVFVGGDYQGLNPSVPNASRTYVSEATEISADATIAGDGGKVIVWSDNGTQFYGNINAQGGSVSGDGGFVEVSGKDYLDFRGTVITLAANGQTGILLLDPSDLEINNNATTDTTNTGGIFEPDNTANISNLQWADINAQLATTSVTVLTGANGTGGTDQGTITINGAGALTNLGVGRSLTITASDGGTGGTIIIGANITSTGSGSITFNAPTQISMGAFTITTAGGAVTFSGPTVLTGNAAIDTTNSGGSAAGANITFNGTINGTVGVPNLTLTAGTGDITFAAAVGNLSSNNLGDVTLNEADDVTINSSFGVRSLNQAVAGTGTFTLSNGGQILANGDITIQSQTVDLSDVVETTGPGAAGDIYLTQTQGTLALNVTDGLVAWGNKIYISAENLQVNTASGFRDYEITLTALNGGSIGVGDAPGDFQLSGEEMQRISAKSLTMVATGAGGITVDNITAGNSENSGTVILNSSGSGNISFLNNPSTFKALTVTSGGQVVVSQDINTEAGAISITGDGGIQLGANLTTVTGAINLNSSTTLTADVTLEAGGVGLVTFGDTVLGGSQSLTVGTLTSSSNAQFGGVVSGLTTLTVNGTTAINTTAITTTGIQTYTGAVDLGANTTLTTTDSNISFGSAIGTTTGNTLTMVAGAGDIEVAGAVGSDANILGDLTISSAKDVTFNGTLDVAGFIQSAGSGTTTFNANLETGAGFSFTGNELTFAAVSYTHLTLPTKA